MRPSLEGRREGDKFTVKWTADGKELVQIFELGVETEYSTLDGRKAKASEHSTIHAHLFEQVFFFKWMKQSIYTMGPNNVLIQNETVDGKTIKYERQIIGDQMIMVSA